MYIKKTKNQKTLIQKYMCIPILITELFIIARVRKQPVLSTDKWVKKMWNGILLCHEQNEILPFAATWMDLLSEISQRKTNTVSHI